MRSVNILSAIFGASSKEDAIKRATPDNRAFGWTLNLGDISAARSYSFEVQQLTRRKPIHLDFASCIQHV